MPLELVAEELRDAREHHHVGRDEGRVRGVPEEPRPLRHVRHPERGLGRLLAAVVRAVEGADDPDELGAPLHRPPQGARHRRDGHVVMRRPDPAGGEHPVGAAPRDVHRLDDLLHDVGERVDGEEPDPELAQAARCPGAVLVHDLGGQDLAPDDDEDRGGRRHRSTDSVPRARAPAPRARRATGAGGRRPRRRRRRRRPGPRRRARPPAAGRAAGGGSPPRSRRATFRWNASTSKISRSTEAACRRRSAISGRTRRKTTTSASGASRLIASTQSMSPRSAPW